MLSWTALSRPQEGSPNERGSLAEPSALALVLAG
jgi:hypothetical protein